MLKIWNICSTKNDGSHQEEIKISSDTNFHNQICISQFPYQPQFFPIKITLTIYGTTEQRMGQVL
jgi:hypothetical protein